MGGRCTAPLHITCQKITVDSASQLVAACRLFAGTLTAVPQLVVSGHHLEVWYSDYRNTNIAKCLVPVDPALSAAINTLNRELDRLRVTRHYHVQPVPDHVPVTVLEGLGEDTRVLDSDNRLVRCRLFTVRELVISRMAGPNEFEVLERHPLAEVENRFA